MAFPLGLIIGLFKTKNVLGIFKSKWTWIILLVVIVLGFGWWQTTRAANYKHQAELLSRSLLVAEASKQKLIEDMARMRDINNDLALARKQADDRLWALRGRLDQLALTIQGANTPEKVKAAQATVSTVVINSYSCLEAATGKEGAACE